MSISLLKFVLQHKNLQCNAFVFIPAHSNNESGEKNFSTWALMTHGYTSHKGALLNWAARLCEERIPTVLFDLPGHYLGGFSEVEQFDEFSSEAHLLFVQAFHLLSQHTSQQKLKNLLLIGHSLGALLAFKSSTASEFAPYQKTLIGVGFGHGEVDGQHLFQSPLYKSTLNLRAQLISPALAPEHLFPWIAEEKKKLKVAPSRVHLICGQDDLVVAKDGPEQLAHHLRQLFGVNVSIDRPKNLPHHQPELAAGLIKAFLKKEKIIGSAVTYS